MPFIIPGIHHFHLRKRKYHRNMKKYPNKDLKVKLLDNSMLIVGSLAPLFAIPQIIQVYTTRKTDGLAWPTFFLIGLSNILWIVYGVVHKDRQIISANILFFMANALILIGIIIY